MFRKMSKSQALTYALVTAFVGLLLHWVGGDLFAGSAWLVSAFYLFVWYVKSRRDRRLVAISRRPIEQPRPVALPKASANSSDLTLPDFD